MENRIAGTGTERIEKEKSMRSFLIDIYFRVLYSGNGKHMHI